MRVYLIVLFEFLEKRDLTPSYFLDKIEELEDALENRKIN